jgi:hypothetical protein
MRKTRNNHKLRQQGGLTYGWGSVVRPRLQEKVSELAAQKRSLQTYQTQALELVVAHIEAQVDALDLMARLIQDYKVSLEEHLSHMSFFFL